MKLYITILLGITLILGSAAAQKWVSTEVQNKKVVLEEFTGIHCGYCPDGHRIANELAAANVGKVFLINIHSGSFAIPNAGEPDLRTTEGTAIDAAAGVTGYPAGSVNRSTSPWGQGRNLWTNLINGILGQTSPVNVAVKSSIDFTTRQLTVEVEWYYTGSSPSSTNRLTVALTQDAILGYQSDYGNYNPTNWTADGKYKHNHALRMLLNAGGSSGDTINSTTKGSYNTRKYIVTLPPSLNSIDIKCWNLNVVAFIAESQANIYSADGGEVTYDPSLKVDLALKNLTQIDNSLCATQINPKVEVTNNSGKDITSFDVNLALNGVNSSKSYSGTLAKGQKTTLDWGVIPLTEGGNYHFSIGGFTNINGGTLDDMDATNDSYAASGVRFNKKGINYFSAGFNTTTIPSDMAFDQTQNTGFGITTSPSCGANNSVGAVRFPLHVSWGLAGKPGYILFGEDDLSVMNSPEFSYYYAYSDDNFGGTAPTIKVEVSEDCGTTWLPVSTVTCVQTGKPATSGNWYVPVSSEYKKVGVDLDAYKTKSVLFRITGTPGTNGNAMYIDEFSVDELNSVNEITETNLPVYPNPATSEIRLSNTQNIGQNYLIYSSFGEMVLSGTNSSNIINIEKLTPGAYFIKINTQVFTFVKN